MPKDLFQEAGINPQPRDLFQEAGINQPTAQQPSYLEQQMPATFALGRMLRDFTTHAPQNIAAGATQFGQTLAEGVGIPAIKNPDWSSYYGITQPNELDKLVQGATSYLPYTLAGGASKVGQAIAGGAYGAITNTDHPIIGASIGAGMGAMGAAAPEATGYVASKFALKGIQKNVAEDMENLATAQNKDAWNMVAKNYAAKEEQEKQAWDALKQQASDIGQYPYFQNTAYKDALQNKIDTLEGQSGRQSALARKNADAIDMLKGYSQDEHSTFADAFEHNRALNADYSNEITPGKSLPFDTVNYAKKSLGNTINANINALGLEDTLGASWKAANKVTGDKNSIFNETVSAAGKPTLSKFMQYYRGDKDFSDPTNFVKDYLPSLSGTAEGTQKMEQLAAMMGDEQGAKNVIKANIFGNTFTSDGVDLKKVVNKYNLLSPEQQNYLFDANQQQQLKAANILLDKNKNLPSAVAPYYTLAHHTLSGALGYGIGALMGHPFMGLMGGILGGQLARSGMNQLLKIPSLQQAGVNYLTRSASPSLLRDFTRMAIPTAAVPTGAPAATSFLGNFLGGGQ